MEQEQILCWGELAFCAMNESSHLCTITVGVTVTTFDPNFNFILFKPAMSGASNGKQTAYFEVEKNKG